MIHPICQTLKDLRLATGLSLTQVEHRFGVPAVVLGSYERGDRNPPLTKAEQVLNYYGYTLTAVPIVDNAVQTPVNMAAALRLIADQIEGKNATMELTKEYADNGWEKQVLVKKLSLGSAE